MPMPLKFKKPADLKKALDSFFENTPEEEWTVTDLSLIAGSKQVLNDYQKRAGYEDIVTQAKLRIEKSYESDLRRKGRSGDIFALKNFGWTDRQDLNVSGEALNITINMEKEEKKENG